MKINIKKIQSRKKMFEPPDYFTQKQIVDDDVAYVKRSQHLTENTENIESIN